MRAVHPRSESAAASFRALLNTVTGRQLTPARRRLYTVMVSGVLIALGLSLWHLLGAEPAGRVLLVAASVVAGAAIANSAVQGLRNRQVNIELLVTIAAGGAILIGEVWEAAAVTFLFTLGAWLEARTLQGTRRALGELLELAPEIAVVMRDGIPVEVSPWEVTQGETVLVRPGMRLAVDGEVISGTSNVNEAAITGEPLPAGKAEGSRVFAGTVNQDGMLQVRATGVGADTTLARIIQRVEEAQEAKAPTQRFIERFASWYTPAMLAVSALVWAISGNLHLALTFLVISCPGALVISTPVSIVAGIGRAARKGILIKGGEDLERAGRISTVAFDKTGTLTAGQPVLTTIIATGSQTEADALRLAASAELASEHPLARPIIAAARAREYRLPFPDQFESTVGQGIRAQVEGTDVLVGRLNWLAGAGVHVGAAARSQLAELQELGQTAVGVARDGELIGLLGIEDELRDYAAETTAQLRRRGVSRLVMLTGDNERTARAIGRAAGMKTIAEYVQSGAAFTLLGRLGIDFAQGFHIGRPTATPIRKTMPVPIESHQKQKRKSQRKRNTS